jgi:hypothetical protein
MNSSSPDTNNMRRSLVRSKEDLLFFGKSVEEWHSTASQNQLSVVVWFECLVHGYGTDRDLVEAVRVIKEARIQFPQNVLIEAICLSDGYGVDVDYGRVCWKLSLLHCCVC